MRCSSVGERSSGDSASDSAVAWRTRRLRAAGLPEELVRRVAADCAYDLHALLELVDRGCPAELALRILAPIDEGYAPC
jgi:hypothetical protein